SGNRHSGARGERSQAPSITPGVRKQDGWSNASSGMLRPSHELTPGQGPEPRGPHRAAPRPSAAPHTTQRGAHRETAPPSGLRPRRLPRQGRRPRLPDQVHPRLRRDGRVGGRPHLPGDRRPDLLGLAPVLDRQGPRPARRGPSRRVLQEIRRDAPGVTTRAPHSRREPPGTGGSLFHARNPPRRAPQPPEVSSSAPSGTVTSSRSSSQPSGSVTFPGLFVRPRGFPIVDSGNGASASSLPSRSSSSARLETIDSDRRSSPPTGNPLRYQATCLRNSLQPCSSAGMLRRASYVSAFAIHSTSSDACLAMIAATSPSRGSRRSTRPSPGAADRLRNAASRSPNSHGRPRHPRPTTTPSQPVCSTIRSASSASQTSPLPSTGTSRASLSAAIASQSAVPE